MEKDSKKPNKKVFIPLILIVVAVLSFGIYYYMQFLKYETTDDAIVDCNTVALGPKMMGRIIKLYVDEGDSVKAEQLVAELDSSDLIAQKLQAQANLFQMQTNVGQSEARYRAESENIKVIEINADKAKVDFDRASKQKEADVITQEQYENFRKTYLSSNAQLSAAQTQLKVSQAQIESAYAAVENSRAQINVLSTQLKNMRLYSPFDGVVAKRWLLAGDIAQAGQSIFTINNDRKLWVSVFIEETKLKHVYHGQPSEYSVDAVPGVEFYGKVYSIGNNTASRFALIPPSNASGNFTKITQRVQLKVSIDSVSKGKLDDYRLLTGMSAEIKLVKK